MSNVTPPGLENDKHCEGGNVVFVKCINCFENELSVNLKVDKACFELRIRRNNG